jgi:hypothetical protein
MAFAEPVLDPGKENVEVIPSFILRSTPGKRRDGQLR